MQPSTRPNMTSTSRLQIVLHSYLQNSITDASIYSNPKKMVVRKKQTYFNGKSSSDNVLRTQKCSGIKPVKVWRLQKSLGIPRQIQIIEHRSFLPLLRRAGRRNKLVQVDPICDPSGSRDEGLHERTEVMLPSVGHLERHQLVFSRFLAVDAD